MSPYREMGVRPPRRRMRWTRVVSRLLGLGLVGALVWHAPAGCRAMERWDNEARDLRARERASKIANCRARGGSWNEGRNGSTDTEWCSGVTR